MSRYLVCDHDVRLNHPKKREENQRGNQARYHSGYQRHEEIHSKLLALGDKVKRCHSVYPVHRAA